MDPNCICMPGGACLASSRWAGAGGAYGSAVLICLLVVCWLTAASDAQDLCVLLEPENLHMGELLMGRN